MQNCITLIQPSTFNFIQKKCPPPLGGGNQIFSIKFLAISDNSGHFSFCFKTVKMKMKSKHLHTLYSDTMPYSLVQYLHNLISSNNKIIRE
jgi:hypothetical protein